MPSVLRIKNPDGTWYEVTALKGDTGITPNLQVGTVTTGNPGTSAEVTITGTPEEPVLNFKIPKGEPSTGGDGGANIDDITPSTSTTYSSSKIESELTALNDANAALIEVSKTKPNAENTELWIHPNADEVQLPQINDSVESDQDTWSSKKIAAEVSNKVNEKDLASVAKSGSYTDLTNKPTIPTVPSALPNPNALTFTGAVNETYDGSAARSVAIPTVPTALKNPNKLTFKGAVTAEYDGSATVEVTIPEGGSGGTSGNYMPVNNNYVLDANSVTTTQITKTDKSTRNLPNEITGEKWGVIQFVAENDSMGNGTQMYWPIDRAYAGRMYIRGHNKDGWTEWKRYATTSEIPTVPTTLPNPNKLTFTGAVTAEYDGSSEVSVEIPAGGGSAYELPIANETTLGGVMPVTATSDMTQDVGVTADGRLKSHAVAAPSDEQVKAAVDAFLTENPVSAEGTFKGEILFSGETDGETSYWGTNDVVFEDGIYAVDMHKDSGVSTSKIINVYIGGATGGQTDFRMMHCSLAEGNYTANDAVTVFAVKNNTVRVLAATQNGGVPATRDFAYFREGRSKIKGVWFGRQAWTSEILPAGITFRLWRLF